MSFFFFFNATSTTEIYTLSLHALFRSKQCVPIYNALDPSTHFPVDPEPRFEGDLGFQDRKSTRLNSSHLGISYAVFCLKKKKEKNNLHRVYISMVNMIDRRHDNSSVSD